MMAFATLYESFTALPLVFKLSIIASSPLLLICTIYFFIVPNTIRVRYSSPTRPSPADHQLGSTPSKTPPRSQRSSLRRQHVRSHRHRTRPRQSNSLAKTIWRHLLHQDRRNRLYLAFLTKSSQGLDGQEIERIQFASPRSPRSRRRICWAKTVVHALRTSMAEYTKA